MTRTVTVPDGKNGCNEVYAAPMIDDSKHKGVKQSENDINL